MKKGIMVLAGFLAIIFSGCAPERHTVLPLNESQVNEAIEFGRKNSSLTDTEFISGWTLDSGGYLKGEGRATIITPFLRIALLSKRAAKAGGRVEERLIKSLLAKEAGFITFDVTLYGDSHGFGRTAEFILEHGGMEHEPVAMFMPSYAEIARDYTCIASGWAKFRKEDIPGDATVNLSVKFRENEEREDITGINFEFDLSKFK